METVFYKGGFGSSFGGPAWGEVAKTLRMFVGGEISLVLMADVGFALAHNNGPIFNKGRLYTGYHDTFTLILDVQRAGQIPHLVESYLESDPTASMTGMDKGVAVKKALIDIDASIEKLIPTTGVDWRDVSKAGAVSGKAEAKAAQQDKWKGKSESKPTSPASSSTSEYVVDTELKVSIVSRETLEA